MSWAQVLVGHSLGAGVCQLLAVLLVAGSEWSLPEVGDDFCLSFLVDILREYIWVNYNDLTGLPHWNHGLF